MRMEAFIIGVGMTRFGKHLDRSLKSLAGEAARAALEDAGIEVADVQAAYVGNAAAGLVTGQEMIRGQVVLRPLGIGGVPVVNVENACASGSTAFQQAAAMVTAGLHDVVLVVGCEKLHDEDKARTARAYGSGIDVEAARERAAQEAASGAPQGRGTVFMDFYAAAARRHMARHGTTVAQFAAVSVKNAAHGSRNPRAQFQDALTLEEVLAAPMIAEPLTRPMCSPIGDGAAALVLASPRFVRRRGLEGRAIRVLASALRSGIDRDREQPGAADQAVRLAYEAAGLGPEALDVVELHDASAPAEIVAYETLGLCAPGMGGKLVESGATRLGGRVPVNTSGGLLRKGHPVGATGVAQLVELTEQLQGRAGTRQAPGARTALAHNNGGSLGGDVAAACITVLQR